jgi:hypothetical protein
MKTFNAELQFKQLKEGTDLFDASQYEEGILYLVYDKTMYNIITKSNNCCMTIPVPIGVYEKYISEAIERDKKEIIREPKVSEFITIGNQMTMSENAFLKAMAIAQEPKIAIELLKND